MEDVWFASVGDDYYFDVNAVKQRKKVIAPYRKDGVPKDWQEENGEKFRYTFPSNFWDDVTVPYWSMPENTPHPTQKPEKLLAKSFSLRPVPAISCSTRSGAAARRR